MCDVKKENIWTWNSVCQKDIQYLEHSISFLDILIDGWSNVSHLRANGPQMLDVLLSFTVLYHSLPKQTNQWERQTQSKIRNLGSQPQEGGDTWQAFAPSVQSKKQEQQQPEGKEAKTTFFVSMSMSVCVRVCACVHVCIYRFNQIRRKVWTNNQTTHQSKQSKRDKKHTDLNCRLQASFVSPAKTRRIWGSKKKVTRG